MPVFTGRNKRGQDTKHGFLPLLTPLTFLRADTSEMCSETRGAHRGVWCSKASFLMEAEPVQVALSKFRAAQRPMSETTHGTEPP